MNRFGRFRANSTGIHCALKHPDHFVIGSDDPPFEAEVVLIEPHGAHDAVHLTANG
ncbi:hypothetical protein [Halocatena marina]|uniref:Uncharacterized protein n=1 Tax=Halocatena marina TaxID=2934937 RepID=A0ABD5YN08_9EURY|nr:hypothetical protein [Halocatena marina]